MSRFSSLTKQLELTRAQAFALLGYAGALLASLVAVWLSLASLVDDYAAYSEASNQLDAIEGRGKARAPGTPGSTPPQSPFLEGETVTVAGAALQQRVAAAVTDVGGNVLSSQVDLQGAQADQGYVGLTANCEIEQAALQQMLYDLEAGMPFLFINQLVIQTPQTSGEAEGGRMRVRLDVSGQWRAAQ